MKPVGESGVVVLGGAGMLGIDVVEAFKHAGVAVSSLDLPEFDITNEMQLRSAVEGKKLIVNCAAYTNVEHAETEKKLADKVNGEAVGRLGELAKEYDAKVIHISTDFVFNGCSETPYCETDEPCPINSYGHSKLAGEKLLAESGCKHCILRIQWTYGSSGSNFVTKLIHVAQAGDAVKVVDDQIGSPTATAEIADLIRRLAGMGNDFPEGIFHYAAAGYASRYEVAKYIFDILDMSVEVLPCKTSDYFSVAKRPLSSRFNCEKIMAVLGERIRSWQGPLGYFVEQL